MSVFPLVGWQGSVQPHWGQSDQIGGSDLLAPAGTTVQSINPGRVTFAGWDPIGGFTVQVHGTDGLDYYYAHLQALPAVISGQVVQVGTILGGVGNTGDAAGGPTHLHLGIGYGIQTGSGADGGLGINFDAVGFLQGLLSGGGNSVAAPNTMYSTAAILAIIDQQGPKYGLSAAQIQVAKAIAVAEGAGGQQIGDGGTSFGPFQFHEGGQLNGFAAWLHDSGNTSTMPTLDQAGTIANQQPALAIEYALQPDGYLAGAIKRGTSAGYSGLNLALYAEQFGQGAARDGNQLRADIIANVTSAWSAVTSGNVATQVSPGTVAVGASSPLAGATAHAGATASPTWTIAPGINIPLPDLSGLSGSTTSDKGLGAVSTSLSQVAQGIAGIPTGINNAVSSILTGFERAGWIALGLALVGLGFWIMAKGSDRATVTE
jgi:hypothetical protein